MSFGLGVFANVEGLDLVKVSDAYYGRSSLSVSKQLEQLVEDTKNQFPSLINLEADDISWGMGYSKERGCVNYFFGIRPDSDIAFDFVLAKIEELNLVVYDPQGHRAFIGTEEIALL